MGLYKISINVTSTEVERSIKEEISPFSFSRNDTVFLQWHAELVSASPIRIVFNDISDFILDFF